MANKNDFATLLEESFKKRKSLEPGAKYNAIVSSVKSDYTFIRTEPDSIRGIISNAEFIEGENKLEPGKTYSVYFLKENHGDYYFTTVLTGEDITPENLEIALEHEIPVYGQVGGETTGGYDVKIGEYNAFCPYSQLDPETKSQALQGKKLKFIVNDLSMKNKKIVLSQKKISDKEKDLKREILKGELKEGSYVTCKVKSIHNFGLIVDMNGIDALVPVSEASFKKNVDLNTEFTVGATVRGKIIGMDWKENKFSISLKDSSNDPWAKAVPFKEGDIVKATVDSIKNFGVFVKLNEHFHALLPTKETGYPPRTSLSNHFKAGDILEVFITEVNPEKKQIAVSLSKARDAKDRIDYENYISEQKSTSESSFGLLLKKSLKK
ncbi:MAG TPA: S1 RNA-binding domain-containing protein [Leptospiraceae bacterium]|nr:S1 RNA-binding domain-containing protein [Leptospiraceae bacterium]HMX31002.1 S1 RNA-binding domain-containing protein [Leptospiraceae bacterium]HMY32179.1 S1 RNA-binding domain-containing protein [Leptospiraceae bacterium]HMZ63820.1 S1 RNA-binding domain-containing protein [Leptospiraceae bacterium]HNA06750.1 S1 RNA-binding domain-containing protein [Leptospiraceae bacterium]